MKQKSYMRYHRYDQNNTKYIKRFELGETVPTIIEPGFTPWMRGTGPHTIETYNKVASGIRRACTGVPKTPEQKQKMRLAKLGVPKTEEHKQNMRLSWQRRRNEQLNEQA
jgi:hypothetical protein